MLDAATAKKAIILSGVIAPEEATVGQNAFLLSSSLLLPTIP